MEGDEKGDLLVVGWGGTYGAIHTAVNEVRKDGKKIGHMHIHYVYPFPKNIRSFFNKYEKIIVCELNNGQMADYQTMNFREYEFEKYNKIQGLPFMISELKDIFRQKLEE